MVEFRYMLPRERMAKTTAQMIQRELADLERAYQRKLLLGRPRHPRPSLFDILSYRWPR